MPERPPDVNISCDRLLSITIREVTTEIGKVSVGVRDARKDLGLITREIASLEFTLQSVAHDANAIQKSPGLDRQFRLLLQHCERILGQFRKLLRDVSPGGSKHNSPWAQIGRDVTTTLRRSLEEQRHMLEFNLDLLNINPQTATDVSPVGTDGLGNSFRDDVSEDLDFSQLRIREENVSPQSDYKDMLQSSLSQDLAMTEKFTKRHLDAAVMDERALQASITQNYKIVTKSYIPEKFSDEKEVVTSRRTPDAVSISKKSVTTQSSRLSQGNLLDANEGLFNSFFVDTDAGNKVLTKYIPHGTIISLLEKGADPDTYDTKHQQLQALRGGEPKLQGPCGTDMSGTSVMALAAIAGDTRILEALLDHGASIDKPRGHVGSPLYAAAVFSQETSVQFLLDRGADPHKKENGQDPPVLAAVRYASLKVLQRMLDYTASRQVRSELYGTALHIAISENHFGKSSEKVQLLLAAGAHPNFDHDTLGTPLLSACYASDYASAHLLVKGHADPNIIHIRRGAPLLAALHRGQIPIASLLSEHGANKDVKSWIEGYNREGQQYDLLSASISSRRADVVKWALQSNFGNKDYWRNGAFNDSIAKFSMHRNLKIYPMIYNHARQQGYSVVRKRNRNPLANAFSLRNYQDE